MPWDLVASGVKRLLRLAYLATIVSGTALIVEAAVLIVDGPPAHRRDAIADWIARAPHWHVNTSLLTLLLAAGVFGAYLVGVTARLLAVAAFALVNYVYGYAHARLSSAWRRRAGAKPAASGNVAPRPTRRSTWDIRRRRLLPAFWALRVVVSPIFPPRLKSDAIWASLDNQFGREALARVLERHPIKVKQGDDEFRIVSAFPYCQLWLRRYTPDVAVPTTARRTVLLLAAAAPAVLLPASLHALVSDLSWAGTWLGWSWPLLVGVAAIAVTNSLREGPLLALETFHQFVIVQFVEEGRPPSQGRPVGEGSSRS